MASTQGPLPPTHVDANTQSPPLTDTQPQDTTPNHSGTREHQPPPRSQLAHYQLLSIIGRGGMGEVYAAHDTRLNRRVAIKRLRRDGDGRQDQLLREALALAKVSHPNVVPIYEIGEHEGSVFLVMEYVEGVTLRDWQRAPRTREELLATYGAAARGLIAAHRMQLVHRDFKPDNVLVGRDGRVRVLDFGLAHIVEHANADHAPADPSTSGDLLRGSASTRGTPAYMSPEQLRSQPTDAASDQFSFCVALYEALYGVRPDVATSLERERALSEELRASDAAAVPEWLQELLARGLSVAPEARFESMQALLDALIEGELAHERRDESTAPAYVFVAHDRSDKFSALRLSERLIDLGIRPWLDVWDGELEDATRALLEAPAVVILGRAPDSGALAARIEADPQTVYVARLAGPDAPAPFTGLRHVELDEAGWSEGVVELARLIGVAHHRTDWLEREAERARVEPAQLSPYRGLEPFRERDARFMFGREHEVAELLERLTNSSSRFLTLIGASGSGKSSLLLAGLCPMLRAGVTGASDDWSIAYVRPGASPCDALARALIDYARDRSTTGTKPLELGPLRAELRERDDTLRLTLGLGVHPGGRLLLIVDQLEELFTEAGLGGEGDDDARAFVHNLLEATHERAGLDGRLWIAATLRADFVQRALAVPALARALEGGIHCALPPMDEAQIRAAVERPAARVGYQVEAPLVDRLVVAAANQAGRLPLLQHILRELWSRRDPHKRVLSEAAYLEAGGLEGAIAAAAERTLEALTDTLGPPGERTTRQLMTRLVHLGGQRSEDTRRRAARSELGEDAVTERVLEAFVREARVLVAAEIDEVETVELAHEALLREWTTLAAWLDADREALQLRQALSRDALLHASVDTREYLWSRGRIEEARRVLDASLVELNQVERAFLRTSERAVRRTRRWVQGGIVALLSVAALVVVVVVSKNLEVERKNLEVERKNHELAVERDRVNEELNNQKGLRASMLAESPGNELSALSLAIEAVAGVTSDANELPVSVFSGLVGAVTRVDAGLSLSAHTDKVVAVAYSPDGAQVATASHDMTARLWDARTGAPLMTLEGHEDRLRALAFSPDGQRLATVSDDQTARVWTLAPGARHIELAHEAPLLDVAFSPDGASLATAGADGHAQIWELDGARRALVLDHDGPVRALAFSPDGQRLASASVDGTARVWRARDGSLVTSFEGHGGHKLHALTWSPDSARVVSGAEDGFARMWDAKTGEQLATFEHGHTVLALAMSPDGARLASGSFDEAAHVWALDGAEPLRSYRHADSVASVAWSPDGTKLVTASGGLRGRSLEFRASEAMVRLGGHDQGVYAVAVSADGARIATGSGDDTARLWDARTGTVIAQLRGHGHDLSALRFSPDGATLATASWDRTVRLWAADSGSFIRTLAGHEGRVLALAFSPDGSQLASAGADQTVHVWDLATGEALLTLDHDDAVVDVAFAPGGDLLVCVTASGSARAWDRETGTSAPFAHPGPVTALAFAPASAHIALAVDEHIVQLWDLRSDRLLETYEGHTKPVTTIRFSSEGDQLVTASEDGSARVWDVATGAARVSLRHTGPVFDAAFTTDGDVVLTASAEHFASAWALTSAPWLAWGCALLESRAGHNDTTRARCAGLEQGPSRAQPPPSTAPPRVVDGDPPQRSLLIEHGVEYVYIPSGTFSMGSPPGFGDFDEHPQHEVTLDGFYIARTELTNAQYALYLDANPESQRPRAADAVEHNQPNQPVIGLSASEAMAYCEWAGCTLPTEAQWEYAARAGTTSAFWYGEDLAEFERFGSCMENTPLRTRAVARRGANAFGLYDVSGNVWEWTLDTYGDYTTPPRPGDGARYPPSDVAYRVMRGGGRGYEASIARVGFRYKQDPNLHSYDVGVRPVLMRPLSE